MDEETKPEETKEETPEIDDAQIEVEKTIEPCDPATMSCDEMRDQIIDLSLERAKYDNSIKKIEEIKTVIPSEQLEKIQLEAINKKKDIDDKIYNIFEKFTVCSRPIAPEEQTKEE
jgi:hypothetical protein